MHRLKSPSVNLLRTPLVIDTNIWISAAISSHGVTSALVQRVLMKGNVVFSDATFAELETRLWKPKFDRYITPESRRCTLRGIEEIATWISVLPATATKKYSRDADDDKFVHLALAASAQWLISGDKDLLDIDAELPFKIISPASALKNIVF